jgi:topoisomerase-4 subunit A
MLPEQNIERKPFTIYPDLWLKQIADISSSATNADYEVRVRVRAKIAQQTKHLRYPTRFSTNESWRFWQKSHEGQQNQNKKSKTVADVKFVLPCVALQIKNNWCPICFLPASKTSSKLMLCDSDTVCLGVWYVGNLLTQQDLSPLKSEPEIQLEELEEQWHFCLKWLMAHWKYQTPRYWVVKTTRRCYTTVDDGLKPIISSI